MYSNSINKTEHHDDDGRRMCATINQYSGRCVVKLFNRPYGTAGIGTRRHVAGIPFYTGVVAI